MKPARWMGWWVLAPSLALAQAREPHTFLRTHVGFTEEDLRGLDAGKAVTRVLDTKERREIAIVGAVRMRASTSFFLRMFRDIERFDTAALAAKKLSDPPRLGDFEDVPIPENELRKLRDCRVGKCSMKLGEGTLSLLQQEVDWDRPDATRQAADILRRQAYRFSIAYLEGGNRALGSYRDKKKPGFIADEFASLLASSPYILEYRPELHRYLEGFPKAKLAGAEDFLYWSQYDYGKPVLRLSHVTIYPLEDGENASAVMTGKQLWYTHFFTTGLDLHALVRDTESDGEAFYLVSLVRMRTDGTGGMFGSVLKKTATRAVVTNVRRYLEASKAAIERYYEDELRRR